MSKKRSVPRHKIDLKNVRRMYKSEKGLWESCAEHIPKYANNLVSFCSLAERLTCEAVVLGEPSSDVLRYAKLTAQLASATFKVGNPAVNSKRVTVERKHFTAKGSIDESLLHSGRWHTGVDWNILAGTKSQMQWLLDFPTKILESSSTTGPVFHYKLVDAYKAYFCKPKSFSAKLKQTVDSAQDAARNKWVKHIGLPNCALLAAISRNQADVSGEVYDALLGHRKWFETVGDFRLSPEGFISISICALVKLARDRKLEVNVESDYLPAMW